MVTRDIQRGDGENPAREKGVAFALGDLFGEYGSVQKLGDIATHYISDRLSAPSNYRLSIRNGIGRSVLYIAEKLTVPQ